MDEKIKTWSLCFTAKENLNMEKALFVWPIVLQYDVKATYRLISRKSFGREVFSPECSLNQPKATRVCVCSINQSNRPISVRLLCLFCSRVFTSRSYENRSIKKIPLGSTCHNLFGDFCMHSFKTWKVSIHLQPNHFNTDSERAKKKCPYQASWIWRKCKGFRSPGKRKTVRNNEVSVVSVLSGCP